jgi:hypothetical protein
MKSMIGEYIKDINALKVEAAPLMKPLGGALTLRETFLREVLDTIEGIFR